MVAFVSTLVLVEALKELQPEFKMHSMRAGEIDMTSALSCVPFGVLLVEDIHSIIHWKSEKLGDKFIQNEFNGFCNHDLLKAEYLHLKTNGFSNAVDFLDQFNVDWVRYVLSRVHDKFLWLEAKAPIKIIKDVI